ncbi:topoisomerase-4 subunit A [Pullulanibacillus pueri]|uniref:DNA topoisomerase 4 subunit A n=1 Tax=Pullulanibacillus pueri TaxID=1437324 RepID=A0A8J2ZVA2_9BACL|nr:DNA topoisomerase IV subunit A [Pullulanibacillus pueri]MBM7680880.1 topoisomerase-4 subunit A [Pullulanibacillus pueri]GGH81193.1 DNA topoisomerase 4 subunit A [Pullulanibacillus pueri]
MANIEKLLDLPLEDVIGDRFGIYSKYIIQERALPDVRDGLKPVQRRILYAMAQDGNTQDKPFRKSAKTVGNVIGNYHPHGDSSVYDAMVRMSQDWKVRNVLIEMHGNNGSVDGDPPAAMRYTEARLSAIASELLRDIDKKTVDFIPNFDDSIEEPTVLPSKFPNLIVNGSTGISAGYATDIPPHNLGEVIDATIMAMENPDCKVEDLMTLIKGPDFPTGGILQGVEGLKKAYSTGKGKVVVRGKATIEPLKAGREQITITELPYEVNKANLVKKMEELRLDRKVEGVAEVRDETDRTGTRVVIELKKDGDAEGILNYFYKNTDLQITYNFNMVAIVNKTPKLMGLKPILEAYIAHQKEVITLRSQYELAKAQDRRHIVDGLIHAVSILDEVIETIRASKDKKDAKTNLSNAFGFTEPQAEAIVNLQLYRLTNTDIQTLQKEADELEKTIARLEAILGSEKKLIAVIKKELKDIKDRYADPRRTKIEEKIEEIKIDLEVTVASEDVMVALTKEGYIKRSSLRSYAASNTEDITMKEGDRILWQSGANTTNTLLVFTNKGNYLYIPIHEIPDKRWKEMGQHIAQMVPIDKDETIVDAIAISEFKSPLYLTFTTKLGQIKRTELENYQAQRRSKPLMALKLKKGDELVDVALTDGTANVLIVTNKGYGLWFDESEASIVGQRAAGVKGINLKDDDYVVSSLTFPVGSNPDLLIATQRGAIKKMSIYRELEKSTRARRGLIMLRELKASPHRIVKALLVEDNTNIRLESSKGKIVDLHVNTLRSADRYNNGSYYIDQEEDGALTDAWIPLELNEQAEETE